jgi:CheY-like chemotaxis protein
LRVVLIEDCVDVRDSLGELLMTWGHEVATASSGPEGVALVVAERPDVAIIDIGLPGLDGYSVAERVRGACLPRPPRLIALSGFGRDHDRTRAAVAGFDAHVIKSPNPSHLRWLLHAEVSHAR